MYSGIATVGITTSGGGGDSGATEEVLSGHKPNRFIFTTIHDAHTFHIMVIPDHRDSPAYHHAKMTKMVIYIF